MGWQVFDSESAEQAAKLLHDICLRQGNGANQITLHSDNGSLMLQARAAVYELARHQHPLRWSAQTRNWRFIGTVHLNPDSPQTEEPVASAQRPHRRPAPRLPRALP